MDRGAGRTGGTEMVLRARRVLEVRGGTVDGERGRGGGAEGMRLRRREGVWIFDACFRHGAGLLMVADGLLVFLRLLIYLHSQPTPYAS